MAYNKQKLDLFLNFLGKIASWKFVFILLGLTILFNLLIFPLYYSSNQYISILDTQFSYSTDEAYGILDKYNDEELTKYLIGELTIDLAYPIIYSLLLCLTIFKLSKNTALSLIPFIAFISDYFENFGVATIINYYPKKLPNIVMLTSIFTSLKWTLVVVSIALILVLLTRKYYKKKYKY